MTYGFRAINGSNIVSIDEDSISYVYLGKWAIDVNQPLEQDIAVHCVGYPLVFFGVPYGTVNGGENNASLGHSTLTYRSGIQMTRIRPAGDGQTWIVTVRCRFMNGGNPGPLYLRVFGQLHQNFPHGAGQSYGARAWDSAGRLIFDTGCRQLRLAGNSYDTEIAIAEAVPGDNERVDSKDSVVGLPFNLANKSIMANTRGSAFFPYYTGSYQSSDGGYTINQYDVEAVTTLFWSNSNALYARRASVNTQRVERQNDMVVVINGSTTYTRVAVIDNALFP
jgi:hypothetical protein